MNGMSIYDRLGEDNLDLLVERFYEKVIKHEVINHLFKTDIEEVKRKQKAFLTQFFGGPTLYAEEFGHPRMRMRHLPHKITPSGALAWLECMRESITSLDISTEFQGEIFQRFPNVAAHMVNTPDD